MSLDPDACPCCGSPAILTSVLVPNANRGVATTFYAVVCTNDACKLTTQPYLYDDRPTAVEVWNNRPSP